MRKNSLLQQAVIIRLERRYAQRFASIRKQIIGNIKNLEAIYPSLVADNARALKDMYAAAAVAMGKVVLSGLRKGQEDYETKRSATFWLSVADDWFAREGLKRARQMSETTISDARRILSSAVNEGAGVNPTSAQLQAYAAISKARADTIVKTEIHSAGMFASRETAKDYQQQTGLQLRKRWDATFDSRTREDHAAMDGVDAIAMNDTFIVGGSRMDRPGDPAGGADQVINCRCVLTYEDDFALR